MKSEDLLKQCRYFRGEDEIPETLPDEYIRFWLAEATAVDALRDGTEDDFLSDYKQLGEPGASSNLPSILLAVLFATYCKGQDVSPEQLAESFAAQFLTDYTASTKR